jgi:hypothetical protein
VCRHTRAVTQSVGGRSGSRTAHAAAAKPATIPAIRIAFFMV